MRAPQSTVYVLLKNERVAVWRPVLAKEHGGTFLLLGPMPEGEDWEFPPGTVVRCELRVLSEDRAPVPVAVEADSRRTQ